MIFAIKRYFDPYNVLYTIYIILYILLVYTNIPIVDWFLLSMVRYDLFYDQSSVALIVGQNILCNAI